MASKGYRSQSIPEGTATTTATLPFHREFVGARRRSYGGSVLDLPRSGTAQWTPEASFLR
jgi:hypothetical protein